jgi:hypothetical protein
MDLSVSGSYWVDTAILLSTALYLLYKYLTRNFDYWTKQGAPEVKTKEIIFGSVRKATFLQRQLGLVFADFYNELNGCQFGGYFDMGQPGLLLRDPELIKQILVKDFASFTDNVASVNEKNDPMFGKAKMKFKI